MVEKDIDCESIWSATPGLKDRDNDEWLEYEAQIRESHETELRDLERRQALEKGRLKPAPSKGSDRPASTWTYVISSSGARIVLLTGL